MNSIELFIKGSLSLLNKKLFLDQLCAEDFNQEISRNSTLKGASEERLKKAKTDILDGTIKRHILLRKKLILSFCWIASAFIIGILTIRFIQSSLPISTRNKFFGVASIFFFSWATLARLGWAGQSWKGDSVYERFDEYLFWVLYFLGAVTGAVSIMAV